MAKAFRQSGLRATLTVVALGTATVLAAGTAAFAATTSPSTGACVSKSHAALRMGHISGVVSAVALSGCQSASAPDTGVVKALGDTANGTPPLIYHGGAVMGTASTGPLVITPIYWNPTGHPMPAAYKSLLSQYISDVAGASGQNTNVFSIATEYSGTDGKIVYQVQMGTPINDTHSLPASGCRLTSADRTAIYADGSGYSACIDDAQVIAETNRVVTANGLQRSLSHVYVMYLPKGVESCFNSGSTSTSRNSCTINHEPSAAYCAYHSQFSGNTEYANMPYPIYLSKTGFTCSTDASFPGIIESPNGNPDADTEVSPTSHEVNEAWTDPDTSTGWYDSSGYENGDECAYVYGATSGPSGAFYNQTINGHHYMTQEEFSNSSFLASGGGCLQSQAAES